jgi:hypothetical protein
MDEQPSKQQQQLPKISMMPTVQVSDKQPEYSLSKTSTGYSSANSASPVSASYTTASTGIEQMRLKFYKEIAQRLVQLAGENIELIVYTFKDY